MKFIIEQNMIGLVTAKWNEDIEYEGPDTVCKVGIEGKDYRLTLSFPVYGQYKKERMTMNITVVNGDMEGYRRGDEVTVNKLGLIKLGPKTWKLDPILMTQVIKSYVILVDVPDPAPWELGVKNIDDVIERYQNATRTSS